MESLRTLDLESAGRLADGALARARQLGLRVSVAVVDHAGHVKQLVRMDGAGWFSSEIALGKAVTAAAFRRDTAELVDRFRDKAVFATALTPLSQGRIIVGEGGCVVRDGDDVVGAVGVSGARSDEDADCAAAGIAALRGSSPT